MSDINPLDGIALLRTMIVHIAHVQNGLETVAGELQRRARVHDLSKLGTEEFDGFTRINRAARENPYGSPEYRAGLKQEKPTINLHYSRNSHHPEQHTVGKFDAHDASSMGWLDIIEMVCDWRGAYLGYGSQGTWEENITRQRERYDGWFTDGQWWLIEQVARWIAL